MIKFPTSQFALKIIIIKAKNLVLVLVKIFLVEIKRSKYYLMILKLEEHHHFKVLNHPVNILP